MDASALNRLTTVEIDRYADELERAIEAHLRWSARIIRALQFGDVGGSDIAASPHLHCEFGRWYGRHDNAPLHAFPEFAEVGTEHATVHALARDLLLQRRDHGAVERAGYDLWVSHTEELRRLFQIIRQGLRRNLGVSARLMAKVFENAAEGVVITTPDGTILNVNRAFTEMTGYSAAEAVGNTPHLLYSGRQDRHFYERMWRQLTVEGAWQGEIWNRRKDGQIYLEWLTITSVRNPQNQITHYVAMFSDITAEKQNEERLYHLAHYDPLTELPNRVLFQDRFHQALARARRGERVVGVMFLDLDGFKEINDQFGHSAGDALLAQVATRLTAQLRQSDTVARLGGDEFAIVLPDLHVADGVPAVAQKIIDAIAKPFTLRGDQPAHITTSIGISLYPQDGQEADDLLKKADIAMYEAKRRGKNQFSAFTPDP